MGACLLVTVISSFINVSTAASGCSSLHTTDQQIFFTSSTFELLQNLLFDLLYSIRPSLWNFDFPRYGYYIVITISYGFGYCFKAIHFDDLIPVLFVTTLVGWLTTWSRLQALVTVGSFFLSEQLDESQSINLIH